MKSDNDEYILRRLNRETRLNEIAWDVINVNEKMAVLTFKKIYTPKKILEFKLYYLSNNLDVSNIQIKFYSNNKILYSNKIINETKIGMAFLTLVNTILSKEDSRRNVEI